MFGFKQTQRTLNAIYSLASDIPAILQGIRKMTTALDDVKTALARVATDIRALADKVSAIQPDDSAALEDVASQLNALADGAEKVLNPSPSNQTA